MHGGICIQFINFLPAIVSASVSADIRYSKERMPTYCAFSTLSHIDMTRRIISDQYNGQTRLNTLRFHTAATSALTSSNTVCAVALPSRFQLLLFLNRLYSFKHHRTVIIKENAMFDKVFHCFGQRDSFRCHARLPPNHPVSRHDRHAALPAR